MSDLNQKHNRAVWFDIPVADLGRANAFYAAVLACGVERMDFEGVSFSVLEHDEGNGGCLVPKPGEVTADKGILLYLNVDGRIRDAAAQVKALGGKVVEDVHAIGPHGFRAIVLDSEGNRIALHSESDA
jgi:predicted enzyme related to lactoylglutathione lyase